MAGGSEYSILADILDKQYAQDLGTNPFIMGAKALPETLVTDPQDKWWESALQGLALGGARGFMTRAGVIQAEEEKRDYETAMLDFFKAQTPQDKEAVIASNRLPPGFAGQFGLAKAVDDLGFGGQEQISPAAATALGLNPNLVGEPVQIANLIRDKERLDKWGDVDFYRDKSAAGAYGKLGGAQDFALDLGTNIPAATKAAEKAREAIATTPIARNLQTLLGYADQIEALAVQGTPIADDAIVTAYLKTIDPPSMARDSEVNRVAEARDYLSAAVGQLNKKILAGSTFTPEEKQNIINAVRVVKESAQDKYWDAVRSQLRPMIADGSLAAFKSFDVPFLPDKYRPEVEGLRGIGTKALSAIANGDRETYNVMRFEIESMLDKQLAPAPSGKGDMSTVKLPGGKTLQIPSAELAGKSREEQKVVIQKYLGR